MLKLGYILLVDDSENDLELAKRALAQHQLTNDMFVVRDGAEALDFLHCRGNFSSREASQPLLILLDIKMPRVSGLEVLAEIKSHAALCHIPVVMLTSSRESRDVAECYRLRANAYVVKPMDFDEFSDAVKTIGRFWAVLNELPASPGPGALRP